MMLRRLIILLALVGAIAGVQSATAANSPNLRLDYSLPDPTPGRTDSDIAFWGNIGVAGNYDGFRVFNTSTRQQLVSYLCRGPQNDVSLWEHNGRLLLFQSIDTPQTNGETVCSQNHLSDTTACGPPTCFEGIRIFDLTTPSAPIYVKGGTPTAAHIRTRWCRTPRTIASCSTFRPIRFKPVRAASSHTRRFQSSRCHSTPGDRQRNCGATDLRSTVHRCRLS